MQKNKVVVIVIVAIVILFSFWAIQKYRKNHGLIPTNSQQSQTPGSNQANNTSPISTLDCTGSNPSCSGLTIQGDSFATLPNGKISPFHGYADPSMRKDPASNRIWMSYSWPNIHYVSTSNHSYSVDIHLSYSDDGGNTWQYQGPLWTTHEDTNKNGSNEQGHDAHEVSNILPVQNGNSVTWYGIVWEYFVPANAKGVAGVAKDSPHFLIAQASSPTGLATAETATLGSANTSSGWGIDTSLSALSPDVQSCGWIFEPALYYQSGTLYLTATCLSSSQTTIVVFSTQPQGDVKSWKWKYNGTLAGTTEAHQLGGDGLTQADIAKGADGSLLLIASVVQGAGVANHSGCRAVAIQSLDTPQLTKNTSGNLVVKAAINTSDLMPKGNGACTYDPTSSTGILIVRRSTDTGALITAIHKTGVKP